MNSNRHSAINVVLIIVVVLAISGRSYYKWEYPYGSSHCCIILMMSGLEQYAMDHGWHYPTGGSSPEASLSLLCKSTFIDPYTIRGMTVSEGAVRRILDSGALLGPDTCGWQYVDGLTRADDPGLAILYCKHALGHNGQRTKDGGRQVVFVGGEIKWISGEKWPAFLEEQKGLLSKRDKRAKAGAPLVNAIIELPDGRQIENFDGSYTVKHQEAGSDGSSGNGTESGSGLNRDSLVWFVTPMQGKYSGFISRTLSFSNLVSAPVKVTFTNGVPDKTNVVFKMKARE
jgi:hypothetical protein